MSDQSKELAALKQQIIGEISAMQNDCQEIDEECLDTVTGGSDSSQRYSLNQNMGARTLSTPGWDRSKIVNVNMGVRTVSAGTHTLPKNMVNQNMGVRTVSAADRDWANNALQHNNPWARPKNEN
jgi:hypothetical protein